jgi:hypothetical protein
MYEDRAATNPRCAEAEAGVPILYIVESDLIAEPVMSITVAFADARDIKAKFASAADAQSPASGREPFQEMVNSR